VFRDARLDLSRCMLYRLASDSPGRWADHHASKPMPDELQMSHYQTGKIFAVAPMIDWTGEK
jgi:hypothetical protein